MTIRHAIIHIIMLTIIQNAYLIILNHFTEIIQPFFPCEIQFIFLYFTITNERF